MTRLHREFVDTRGFYVRLREVLQMDGTALGGSVPAGIGIRGLEGLPSCRRMVSSTARLVGGTLAGLVGGSTLRS